jgi:hypothetical protein
MEEKHANAMPEAAATNGNSKHPKHELARPVSNSR